MGEARRRGTKDERIAQAVERERIASERRSEEHRALMERQRQKQAERIAKLPPEARKEALLRRASPKHTALMAAAVMALAMPTPGKPRGR